MADKHDVQYLAILLSATVIFCFFCGCAGFGQKVSPAAKPVVPQIDLAVGYKLDPAWPVRPGSDKWEAMCAIAVDQEDRVWTLNRGTTPVQVYTTDGKFLFGWGGDQLNKAHGMRLDSRGNVWIVDVGLHVVRKFTQQGKLLLTLGTPGESGEDETHFNKPTDVAVTPAGDIFVADGYENCRIVHFDARGQFVKTWGKCGVEAGELNLPHAIALDSKGRLYVAERNNARIQVFNQNGKSLAQWRNLFVPWDVYVTPDDMIYVCGSSPMRYDETEDVVLGVPPKDQLVMKLDRHGRVLELNTFGYAEEGKIKPGRLSWLHAVAADSVGNLYLGDIMGQRAQKFIRLPAQR